MSKDEHDGQSSEQHETVSYRSSPPVLSRSDREKMAERGKSSASRVAMKLVILLLMQITSLVALRSLSSSHTCIASASTFRTSLT